MKNIKNIVEELIREQQQLTVEDILKENRSAVQIITPKQNILVDKDLILQYLDLGENVKSILHYDLQEIVLEIIYSNFRAKNINDKDYSNGEIFRQKNGITLLVYFDGSVFIDLPVKLMNYTINQLIETLKQVSEFDKENNSCPAEGIVGFKDNGQILSEIFEESTKKTIEKIKSRIQNKKTNKIDGEIFEHYLEEILTKISSGIEETR